MAHWTAAVTSVTAGTRANPCRLWEKVDAAGRPAAWLRITKCGGVYEGQIVKIFPNPGEGPSQWRFGQDDGTEGGPEHGDEDRCNRPRQHDRHAGALRQRTRIAAEPSVAAGVLMVPPFLAQLRGREAGALAVQ